MPGYIHAVLLKFTHILVKQRDAPHVWTPPPFYVAKVQYSPDVNNSPALEPKQKMAAQKIVGSLLYYALAIDATILVALGDIASKQSKATRNTRQAIDWLLDYAPTHPVAKIRYKASNTTLWSYSNASYLSIKEARSRAGAVFFLDQKSDNPDKPLALRSKLNGFVYGFYTIIRHVVSLATEVEIVDVFLTAQAAVPMRTTLE